MSMHMTIHDELIEATEREYSRANGTNFSALLLEFAPVVFADDGTVASTQRNSVTLFMDDTVLAKRLHLDIAYRLKQRRDELAALVAEAAE